MPSLGACGDVASRTDVPAWREGQRSVCPVTGPYSVCDRRVATRCERVWVTEPATASLPTVCAWCYKAFYSSPPPVTESDRKGSLKR
jgi:hypothetical protein